MDLDIAVGDLRLVGRLELERAPKTCAAFVSLLPFRNQLLQARWSGEAAWIPLGALHLGLPFENHTSYPAPGQVLFYPGGFSETEILVPYGPCCFASKLGQLAGSHFMTIVDGADALAEIGRLVQWRGAQEISIDAHVAGGD
jgi:hypothetical protein